ncbi:MAG TPA: FAD-dependent oxidoreductase [Planctomycetaceae bacterium]|nr:FAD-dependent oxidoreductase [Planctomycetaceae bacterium]
MRQQSANAGIFHAPAAIYSSLAGEVDPYRLTHALLKRVVAFGSKVFDRTAIRKWNSDGNGVPMETEHAEVCARWRVIAAGYESATFLPSPVAKPINIYAFVSEPVTSFDGWTDRCPIWETARPYLYLRTTRDGRILAGGNDSPSADPDAGPSAAGQG